jgi:hypothetical protein
VEAGDYPRFVPIEAADYSGIEQSVRRGGWDLIAAREGR